MIDGIQPDEQRACELLSQYLHENAWESIRLEDGTFGPRWFLHLPFVRKVLILKRLGVI